MRCIVFSVILKWFAQYSLLYSLLTVEVVVDAEKRSGLLQLDGGSLPSDF